MQETNLYAVTFPPMMKTLQSLSKLITAAKAHADAKKTERLDFSQALLQSRLVFDQFPFVRQIQIATDNAKGAAGRLGDIEVPRYEDTEKSFDEIQARIQKTLDFLETVKPDNINGKEDVQVSLPYYPDKYMTGFEYVTEYLLPNFYFHATTAYAILRSNGMPIGKADYMGNLPLKD